MKEIEKTFGRVIRKRRERMELSQEAFADKAGVHRTYISSIERGKVQVSIGIAMQLANALETRLSVIWRDIEKQDQADNNA